METSTTRIKTDTFHKHAKQKQQTQQRYWPNRLAGKKKRGKDVESQLLKCIGQPFSPPSSNTQDTTIHAHVCTLDVSASKLATRCRYRKLVDKGPVASSAEKWTTRLEHENHKMITRKPTSLGVEHGSQSHIMRISAMGVPKKLIVSPIKLWLLDVCCLPMMDNPTPHPPVAGHQVTGICCWTSTPTFGSPGNFVTRLRSSQHATARNSETISSEQGISIGRAL